MKRLVGVTQSRTVARSGNQAEVPEYEANGRKWSRSRIPQSSGGDLTQSRNRTGSARAIQQSKPGTAGTEQREQTRRRLPRTSVIASAEQFDRHPFQRTEQQQNGGDQGSGVTDTDPPNEVGMSPPNRRNLFAPQAPIMVPMGVREGRVGPQIIAVGAIMNDTHQYLLGRSSDRPADIFRHLGSTSSSRGSTGPGRR